MKTTEKSQLVKNNNNVKLILIIIGLLISVYLGLIIVSKINVNILWFKEVNYLEIFWKTSFTKLFLWLITFLICISFLSVNFIIANQQKKQQKNFRVNDKLLKDKQYSQSPELKLKYLFPIIISFSLLISISIIYYTKIINKIYYVSLDLPNLASNIPKPFQLNNLPEITNNIFQESWVIIVIIIFVTLLILKTELWLKIIAVYYSFLFAFILSGYWGTFLQYIHSIPFNDQDPIFYKDLSFYIFKIPFLQIISLLLQGLFIYTIVAVTLIYLLSNNSISDGKFKGFSRYQLQHLYGLAALLMIILAAIHWLNRYLLLLSPEGVVYGASFTDINISLPRETIASIYALIMAIWLLIKSITGSGKKNRYNFKNNNKTILSFSVIPFILYFSLYSLGLLLGVLVQTMIVQPNELALEKPYIIHNIKETRTAFNLDKIEVKTFNPEGNLTIEDIEKNYLTINNIRLWDTRPILQANRQLQQIRPYYVFFDADIDRYNIEIKKDSGESQGINKQVIIAGRELDSQLLPSQAQTWVNQHLVYTHGYGFTMSPVNRVAEGGLPYYFIKDIGTPEDPGALKTTSEGVRNSIPIYRPRIYYGEVTNDYVMTNTKVSEFDFPSGEENVYHTYDGEGGIYLNSFGRKLLFSVYLKDWRMLLTNNFTSESRILFRRNLRERLSAITPFLYYDRDAYLVAAKGSNEESNHLYWLIDGYTISDHFPYSDPGDNNFNYIRNSVKALINAEDGDVTFYISDENDPIIKVWKKIFPHLFQPLKAMPKDIKQHIRYPVDFFDTQSERLLTYHVTDPQVLYNREDQWQVPEETFANEILSMQPYYLIMKLPIAQQEEFILLHPYTPVSRPNLIAWLAARSDDENYGKLLLYQFPKQRLVYGPDQIQALINQDPIISGQISLWDRQGSKAIQGHLLVIPIEESLLYVEPVYIEADKNSVPTLARVIVVYENKIVMAETLRKALDNIFSDGKPDDSPIIRFLENSSIN
ncbi:MAG: COG1615 family transporter [Cyanobacteria bacterium]|nr:COG1615 family transporter [Cyanobacteria bacterium CG_2015-16_32_12]NCQ05522.1 COG1615 family transporter [Cyanobacteria bacterium CG_2015-09_32_10]NCQ42376.1 COG1615 family transporter [Cyanobacteria bacterium CG_2015-04_32_10]NCS83964.1 COG1615 family transporter [Cyanobacteria bacterium CG_2015-02_32_10]